MAANDVYLITFVGGNEYSTTENTFTYRANSANPDASAIELGEVFREDVVPAIRAILAAEWGCLNMTVKNLFDDSDFEQYVFSSSFPGLRSGETLPFFVTLNFKSAKPSLSQDPARKLMGWLSNSDILGQVVVDNAGYFAVLNAFAAALGATLTGANSSGFLPVVTKRIKYITPKGKVAYRLPENSGEATTLPAINWGYDPFIDHRTTRKIGRGT